jgi:purine-nucleoside phosphorylase
MYRGDSAMSSHYDRIELAAASIRSQIETFPKIAIVLGSGLGHLADRLASPKVIPYASIPHFPTPSIEGHAGNLLIGLLGQVPVAMLQGRVHFYEGHDFEHVTFATRVLKQLGVTTLILTAATGGISYDLQKGDLVALSDHINGLGLNPLRGPNDDRLGTRFPDMTEVYSAKLRQLAIEVASSLGFMLKSGIYYAMPGPSYETPAEIRMLRALGADVVGMSTVPEAIAARHGGMSVLGFAMVTNAAAGVTGEVIHHGDVIDVAKEAGQRLGQIIEGVVSSLTRD